MGVPQDTFALVLLVTDVPELMTLLHEVGKGSTG